MATSCSVSSNKVKYDGRYLKFTCTQTPQVGKGKSTIDWKIEALGGNYEWYSTGPTTAKIGSKQVYYCERKNYDYGKFPVAKNTYTTGSTEVDHNDDGTLTLNISITTAIYYNASTAKTDSVEWILDPVYKSASLTAATDFNDEENPTITYSNPAGEEVTTLQACIASTDAQTIYVPYRDIDKTGNTYTFNLTDTERSTLRNACPNANSMKVKFYVKTINSGNTYYSSLEKTMTIVNAKPTFDASIVDEGVNSIALTGDPNNKVIKGFNYIKYSSGATAIKGATIVSQSVTCGNKTVTNSSGYMSNVDSGEFIFKVKDSRGNENTTTIKKTLIEYVSLTCTFDAKNPTADGNMTLIIKGNYFNGSFGDTDNSLTVQYKMLKDGAAYKDWTTVASRTISGNTYTATENLTGLDYQSVYTIETRAQDEVLKCDSEYVPTNSNAKKFKTKPLFDWSDEDFAFNVPVGVDGTISATGNITTSGNIVASGSGRVTGKFISNLIPANADLNDYTIPGMYYCPSNATVETMSNAPIANAFALFVELHAGVTQTLTTYGTVNMKVYKRNYYNGSWGAWRTLADLAHPVGSVVTLGIRYKVTSDTTYQEGKSYYSYSAPNFILKTVTAGATVEGTTYEEVTPQNEYGGTWTLIDKEFTPGYVSSPFTNNTTNTSSSEMQVSRAGHTVFILCKFTNKVALTDTSIHIGTFNLANIGVKSSFDNSAWVVGNSDGGNSVVYIDLYSTGQLYTTDINYSLTSISAGKVWVFTTTMQVSDIDQMLDSACNKFYWKRTA